eukprot:686207_1
MFARLFGTPLPSDTKSIFLKKGLAIRQESFIKLLIHLDTLFISDYNDVIIISSPYSIPECTQSIHESLNSYHLSCITSLITSLLFGDTTTISSKLQFVTTLEWKELTRLMNIMSIIIIDLTSSQYIAIPTHITDLNRTNNTLNRSTWSEAEWRIMWSINASPNFIQIMNDIYNSFKSRATDFFAVRSGRRLKPPTLHESIQTMRTAVQALERRETRLENKIAIELQKAKTESKARNKKGALFHLKRKRELEQQLCAMQGKKLGLETQIMSLEDIHISPLSAHRNATTQRYPSHEAEEMDDINEQMDCVDLVYDDNDRRFELETELQEMEEMEETELETELQEMEEMEETELETELQEIEELEQDELEVMEEKIQWLDPSPSTQVNHREMTEEDLELAELEAMML